jgi:hypothetical protein
MNLHELLNGGTINHTTAMYNDKPRNMHPAYPQSQTAEPNHQTQNTNHPTEQEDKVTMDIPLFIRLLEWAKEDSETDMDLHEVAERITKRQSECLTMDDYDSIIIPKSKD